MARGLLPGAPGEDADFVIALFWPETGALLGFHRQDISGRERQSFTGAFWSAVWRRVVLVENGDLVVVERAPRPGQ